ncbi:uncharacterized protein LOC115629140 isoform X2 [Scaptodrosophila lebanonensis]|nr:uncharacterized protein LOC115629140 isoform X2 [Scaptodrosophila lebanonensis]XP_030381351.1 uncharacterized protein LOC115629140 isoform X2 [Scaptodrosophila lebanonensis]XP_030381352.1 uncharacterized protein LOC115629140 isoform X2 [Scaptodrosophila lebanonensis]
MALNEFNSATDNLSQFETRITSSCASDASLVLLKAQLDEVRILWDKIAQESHRCKRALKQSESSALGIQAVQAKYEYCYLVYERCATMLTEQIEKASVPSTAPAPAFQSRVCSLPSVETKGLDKRRLVNSQLKILSNLSPLAQESVSALKELQSTIQGCLTTLEHCSISTENWDCLLVFLCSSKLPRLTLSLWEHSLQSKTDIPTWREMNTFLIHRYQTLEAIEFFQPSHEAKVGIKAQTCKLCSKETHPIRFCPRFLQKSVNERAAVIKQQKLCFNCFARGHQWKNCKSVHNCLTCKKRHNTLLHRGAPPSGSQLQA